jgi:hypothetical protein
MKGSEDPSKMGETLGGGGGEVYGIRHEEIKKILERGPKKCRLHRQSPKECAKNSLWTQCSPPCLQTFAKPSLRTDFKALVLCVMKTRVLSI